MSIKPILFNYNMVQAIIDGRKTETRRVINGKGERYPGESVYDWCIRWGHKPQYSIGDFLYVRESFMRKSKSNIVFKADYDLKELEFLKKSHINWKPSIHMPQEYARLWLEVLSVDAQELEDISDEDILKEGVYHTDKETYVYQREPNVEYETARECFMNGCWDSTVSDRLFKSENNPYVWVYSFRVLPIEELLD